MRGKGKTVICAASTGIAALLLPGGRTSHSHFGIPVPVHNDSMSKVAKHSQSADILRDVDLIIWDEVLMQHKFCFEVVHQLLCDMRSVSDNGLLFAGVPVVLGGDFA
jgi:hypothetical protein